MRSQAQAPHEQTERVHLIIPVALHEEVRAAARAEDRPKSRVIRSALREYIERHRAGGVTSDEPDGANA